MKLAVIILLANLACLYASKNKLGSKSDAEKCTDVAAKIMNCTRDTKFNAAKFEADIKKCYNDICCALPDFYADDKTQGDNRKKCDNDVWIDSMKPTIIKCSDPKIRELVDDSKTAEAWRNVSFNFGLIAYMRYSYLFGKPNDTTVVSRIPDLIRSRTIASTCGCDKVKEMQDCIKKVKHQARKEYKDYQEHFDQCFDDNNKCSKQYDILNKIHCECNGESIKEAREWIKKGGNSCDPKDYPSQRDVPTRIMKANSECYMSSMDQEIDYWWNAEPC